MADIFHSDSAVFARHVLALNDRGSHTIPARGLYPHQWLWDSCFIAIGLRHISPHRAEKELTSLVRGQWRNGMIPHMLLHPDGWRSFHVWQSHRARYSLKRVGSSGITQPPMLAEAVWRVGESLNAEERKKFFRHILPHLVAYHQWIYRERDPHNEGLALLIHPWESGMDNTPPWMKEMHANRTATWIRLVDVTGLDWLIEILRRDRRWVLEGQRANTIDMITLYSIQRRLRRKRYDIHAILRHSYFAVEDVAFNSIFIRANALLQQIATSAGRRLPADLVSRMHKTPHALELLRDGESQQYYSRNFATHELIHEGSVASLLPLYAGTISKKHARQLVDQLKDKNLFGTPFPVPSVPQNSSAFRAQQYWQGPSWVNINWLIIDGLQRYGFTEEAQQLTETTLHMVDQGGMREYFNPLTGNGLGAENFSWTAALTIDLLAQQKTAS